MSIAEVASVSKSTSVEGLPFPRLWTGKKRRSIRSFGLLL
jgi:hypothetical protein